MREEIDPSKIEDEGLREVVRSLMNLVEELSTQVAKLAEEIQRLRDENNRLKGEQGKPKIKPNVKGNPVISSEQERRVPKAHHKTHKHAHLSIDRVEVVKLDRQAMPADAQLKGYEDVIVQDLDIRMQTIKFRKEKYYSKSQKRTYLATLPEGYQGQFGPEVKAWVLTLYYADGMSEPKILDFLQTAGLSMSAGQLSALLSHPTRRASTVSMPTSYGQASAVPPSSISTVPERASMEHTSSVIFSATHATVPIRRRPPKIA
jgi:hypothetical protein